MARNKCITISLPLLLLVLTGLIARIAHAVDYATLCSSVSPERAARYRNLQNFHIKGICGTARLDLAVAYGANTIRTYTPPSRQQLDEFQRMGLKVIIGIWMPKQGENSGNNGKWNYDYRKDSAGQLASFARTVDRIGDHPSILLWCLGNEVPLEPAYLETVNRMSELLHQKHPRHLTSLTMVNASKEKIDVVKQYAPDLDIIGYNSYGHGAVGAASQLLEQEWGRAYYVSELGPQGPWWGRKTAWGEVYEQSCEAKLEDLRKSFQKIDAAPRCLGSAMFLWGFWTQQKPTYFSAFLSPQGTCANVDEKELCITPMAEEFCHYWSGKYPSVRAPLLTRITVAGIPNSTDAILHGGQRFKVTAVAVNPNTPAPMVSYRWWILDHKGEAVVGPVNTDQPDVELQAPTQLGTNYSLMAFVLTSDRRASGFTVPMKVEEMPSSGKK